MVSPRLREVVARRLQRLEAHGDQLLAALAVVDDGFTGDELTALAGGATRVGEPLDEGHAAGVRVHAWPVSLPARTRARGVGLPSA